MSNSTNKNGKIVLVACVTINLIIGVLYAWSVLRSRMVAEWGWTNSQAGFPYMLAVICIPLAMIVGGRIQDKIGPRWLVTAGGLLTGLGFILSGIIGNNFLGVTLAFGLLVGIGIGFGYGCVTPPAIKWFHPSKKGLISGLIVGGFGMAAVYYAPLTTMLFNRFGIENTFIYLGIGALVISVIVAQFVRNPPEGYVPAAPANAGAAAAKAAPPVNFSSIEMLKTKRFYLMFLIYTLASSVGLMFIGQMKGIAESQAGVRDATLVVSFLALMNAAGRVAGGKLSDKIGRINTLFVVLALQMVNMAVFRYYTNLPLLLVGIVVVGFCFGTLLSVFPAMTADQYGLKNLGLNYGIMFIAWGLSGVIATPIATYFKEAHGNFNYAYIICAGMMAAMVCVNWLLKKEISKRSS